jgi:hypothetical protein
MHYIMLRNGAGEEQERRPANGVNAVVSDLLSLYELELGDTIEVVEGPSPEHRPMELGDLLPTRRGLTYAQDIHGRFMGSEYVTLYEPLSMERVLFGSILGYVLR